MQKSKYSQRKLFLLYPNKPTKKTTHNCKKVLKIQIDYIEWSGPERFCCSMYAKDAAQFMQTIGLHILASTWAQNNTDSSVCVVIGFEALNILSLTSHTAWLHWCSRLNGCCWYVCVGVCLCTFQSNKKKYK